MTSSPTAKAPRQPNKLAGEGVSRFYARNGDVFMVSAWGGFYLSPAEVGRMLDLWSQPEPDPITAAVRAEMAAELMAALAVAHPEQRIAA